MPLFRPIGSKTKTNRDLPARVSCAWRVFASNSDWFIGLFTTVVIGQSNYFGLVSRLSIENRSMERKFRDPSWCPLYRGCPLNMESA